MLAEFERRKATRTACMGWQICRAVRSLVVKGLESPTYVVEVGDGRVLRGVCWACGSSFEGIGERLFSNSPVGVQKGLWMRMGGCFLVLRFTSAGTVKTS